jgi:hypothetical protein
MVVHPAFQNKNLCGIVKTAAIARAGRHAKVRMSAYRSVARAAR